MAVIDVLNRLFKPSPPIAEPLLEHALGAGMYTPIVSSVDDLDGRLLSFEEIYRSQPVLAGAIDKIARRAASLPIGAYTESPDGSRMPVARSDGLATLLRRPRPRVAGVHILAHVFQSLLIHGNALVAKARTHGDPDLPPDLLWPINWAGVSARAYPGHDIDGWYTTQFGEQRYIGAENTIHFAWPAPDGGMVGVSPLEKLGITWRIEDAAQRYQVANFRNGNRPSNAVILPKDVNDQALAVTRAGIEALHKGVDRAGKTIMLSGGATVSELSMSPVEAMLIDQRRLDREEVAIVLDLAGPSLSDTTDASMGNVVERMRSFYRDVLPPWTTLVVETLESQLVEPEADWLGHVVRFDFSDKLRGEPNEQATTLKVLVEAGLLARNEARIELGRPPEGDPTDPANPANQLTVNANNQNTLAALGSSGEPPQDP